MEDADELDRSDIKTKIDELVSDLSCCDRSGCRCWQANDFVRMIAAYAQGEFNKHGPRTHGTNAERVTGKTEGVDNG